MEIRSLFAQGIRGNFRCWRNYFFVHTRTAKKQVQSVHSGGRQPGASLENAVLPRSTSLQLCSFEHCGAASRTLVALHQDVKLPLAKVFSATVP